LGVLREQKNAEKVVSANDLEELKMCVSDDYGMMGVHISIGKFFQTGIQNLV